jgi:hypothetical protein
VSSLNSLPDPIKLPDTEPDKVLSFTFVHDGQIISATHVYSGQLFALRSAVSDPEAWTKEDFKRRVGPQLFDLLGIEIKIEDFSNYFFNDKEDQE